MTNAELTQIAEALAIFARDTAEWPFMQRGDETRPAMYFSVAEYKKASKALALIRRAQASPSADVTELARALVAKLEEIAEHPSFKGIWGYLHVHGYHYSGPSWDSDLEALRAALPIPQEPDRSPTKEPS